MELDIEKLRANLLDSIKHVIDEKGNIHASWESGITICGLRPTEDLDSIFPNTEYSHIELYTKTGESTRENLIYLSVDEYVLSVIKDGYLSNTYNQIEVEIRNKEFVSFKTSWNQTIVDEVENQLSITPIGFRLGRFGCYKSWYMDEVPYKNQEEESLVLPENFSLSNLDDCLEYFKSICFSNDPNWDCSILDIKFSGGQLYTITKEVYIFQSDKQRQKDRPDAFINEIVDTNSFSTLTKELIKNNIWSSFRLYFKTSLDGSSEIYIEDGDRQIVPFWMKNKIKGNRLKAIEEAYAQNNQLFKTKSFSKEELLVSIFDNVTIDFTHLEKLTCLEYNRNSGFIQPNYINSRFSFGWNDKEGKRAFKEIKEIYNESLLFLAVHNLIEQYYPEEVSYWTELEINFDWKKLLTKNFIDNFSIEFIAHSSTPIKRSIFKAKGVRETKGAITYSFEEYEAIEKRLDEEEAQEKLNHNEPITPDYLLQNIYGCISANVPDDFVSIEAVITRSFEGDIQQLSGSYSYKPKGLFSSSKLVEPGEQIYPINVTIRLLDEFYTEESKNWRKAVLTFKNDGTCNVKIGK